MTHWEVVWVCFGLTVAVFVIDFWSAHRAAGQLRERMMLADDQTQNVNQGAGLQRSTQ